MLQRLKDTSDLIANMGWGYVRFRLKHELLRRSGLMKKRFPMNPPFRQFLTLAAWKNAPVHFFFKSREAIDFPKTPRSILKEKYRKMKMGRFPFFNSTECNLGVNYNWTTSPDTGYTYDAKKHWTEIADYSSEAGDIKYVWEKSRFSFLYDVIRYDYHFGEDCSSWVFDEILSWIEHNPINCGPNYRCSQETSLRVLNWTFALHYYRNAGALTEEVFDKMQFAIYWQMRHVYDNIDFSRIAVRNNHAITESLALYLVGLLYPQYPDSEQWKKHGKKWFEEEISYQVYEDGTFLQFSMNYHRVVVQLLSWAITLADKNDDTFKPVVYERAKNSVMFLRTCMIEENGKLPNYGANDGALFFKLNDSGYRDYRPTLSALAKSLNFNLELGESEDELWYGIDSKPTKKWIPSFGMHSFEIGGYYIFREEDTLTFIRCGNHRDRPSQADNLHMDVWYKGQNVLADAGSYKYNTDKETLKYFMGTASHNTVMLNDYDQMKKGGRFIWYYWTQCKETICEENDQQYIFRGTINAFAYLKKDILHTRKVTKIKGSPVWEVEDIINHKPARLVMKQKWHLPLPNVEIQWESKNDQNNPLQPIFEKGFISNLYGKKEVSEEVIFESVEDRILTRVCIKEKA